MNTKYKFVRLVVAATFGSLLWAGCASDRTYYATTDMQPVDLTQRRADTHPESRTGLEHYAGWTGTYEAPVIEEPAGALRRP